MVELQLELDHTCGKLADQVADALRRAIRSGCLQANDWLPATRRLAADLGTARGPVVEAYERLTAEGYFLAQTGIGTRVAPQAGAPVRTDSALVDDIVATTTVPPISAAPAKVRYDLRPGLPDLASFPRRRWSRAVRHVIGAAPHQDLAYPARSGAPALREALTGYLRRVRGVLAPPAQLVVTNGLTHALSIVLEALAHSGHQRVAVEDPSGLHHRQLLTNAGLEPVGIPVDENGVDVAALARSTARAVLITPTHQYPTGVVLAPHRRTALIDWAREHDALIIENDYDSEFRYDRRSPGCLQGLAPDRVILLGSVSKTLAPSTRLGWAVAPPRLAAALAVHRALTDLGSSTFDQQALAHLITSGAYTDHRRAMHRLYQRRRTSLVEAVRVNLPHAHIRGIPAGLHMQLELPGTDETSLIDAATDEGLALTGVGPMRLETTAPAAVVLGFAQLPERNMHPAIHLLATLVHQHPSPDSSCKS